MDEEIKDALADIERRKRVAKRCISTTIASTAEIVEDIEATPTRDLTWLHTVICPYTRPSYCICSMLCLAFLLKKSAPFLSNKATGRLGPA